MQGADLNIQREIVNHNKLVDYLRFALQYEHNSTHCRELINRELLYKRIAELSKYSY